MRRPGRVANLETITSDNMYCELAPAQAHISPDEFTAFVGLETVVI
jgi:hypothetical protein